CCLRPTRAMSSRGSTRICMKSPATTVCCSSVWNATGAPLPWLYGPLLAFKMDREVGESRRLSGSNYAQAIGIVDELRCREVYVYAIGQEPWLNYVMTVKYRSQSRPIVESNRLIKECRSRGIPAERLFGEKEILVEA